MKRKVKKYAEGNVVRTRTDDEIAEDTKNPYGRYMPKTKEYSLDEVKSGISKLFGGSGGDESKFSDLESVGGPSRRARTIEEQIGRKAEEAPRSKISDYSTNKGITTVSEDDASYKVEKAAPKTSGKSFSNKSSSNKSSTSPGRSSKEPADNDKLPSRPYPENTKPNDERKSKPYPKAVESNKAIDKKEESKAGGPGGAKAVDKTERSFKGTIRPENATMGGSYNKTGIPATDAEGFKAMKDANKANLRSIETENQRTFKERAEAAKAEADKAEKKAAKAAKKEGSKAKSSSTAGKMAGTKMDASDPYSMTLGSDLDPKRMMNNRRLSNDHEMKKGGKVKTFATGGDVNKYKPNPTRAELRKEAAEEKVAPPKGKTKQSADIFKEGMKPPMDTEKKKGGAIKAKAYAKGGSVKSASARADGIAIRGKTRA